MYQKRTNKKTTKDDAVSPVVGVMLMLVVTIVIAAVVAVFASGLVETQQPAPTVSASANIDNGNLTFTILSINEQLPAKEFTLILKSSQYNSSTGSYDFFTQSMGLNKDLSDVNSAVVSSGHTIVKPVVLTNFDKAENTGKKVDEAIAAGNIPKGVEYYTAKNTTTNNFDIFVFNTTSGSTFDKFLTNLSKNDPIFTPMVKMQYDGCASNYKKQFAVCYPDYTFDKNNGDLMKALVETLKAGDKVDVELTHIPSNSVVYSKTITMVV